MSFKINDESNASGIDWEFAFPQTGPLCPPEPPSPYSPAQLDSIYTQASQLWPKISRQSCANALTSHFAEGDPNKAIVLIQFYLDAAAGYVTSIYKRNGSFLALRGAVNYGGVSCYLDSLLVAMFSRMDNFEPLLYKKHYEDKATEQFATWVRLFVNLLRNGERITDDIVEALMATAVAAGWTEGCSPISQQDAAEFFVFLTEKLKMPLLALKVDIAHAGKEVEEYDHKLIREQLLYLPVPGTEEDPPILLEECLEVYFSNAINVSRHLSLPSVQGSVQFSPSSSISKGGPRHSNFEIHLQQQAQNSRHRSYSIMSLTSPSLRKTRQSVEETLLLPPMPSASHATSFLASLTVPGASPLQRSKTHQQQMLHIGSDEGFDPLEESDSAVLSTPEPNSRTGSEQPTDHTVETLIQESPSTPSTPQAGSLPSYHQLFGFNEDKQAEARVRDMKKSIWTSNNEIMLPAWMFLQLMPFYADISPNRDPNLENLEADEVANHFKQTRPVLGFCLKRYLLDEHGTPQRNNRTVIVPEEINMPSFVADDSDQKQAFGCFKLVLESAVFHRGNTIHSGHYLALLSEDVARIRKHSSHSSSSFEGPWSPTSIKSPLHKIEGENAPVSSDINAILQASPNTNARFAASNASLTFAPSNSGKKWYMFDDLQSGGERIKEVDFTTVFASETPYMLFYRMVSLEDGEFRHSNQEGLFSGNPSLSPINPHNASISRPDSAMYLDPLSKPPSRSASPETEKDKKRKPKFFRRYKEKEREKHKDYASKYREEKCSLM